jgi:nucleotide-binding universal stress UspA family protein
MRFHSNEPSTLRTMNTLSVLCPLDFSEPSRTALSYAGQLPTISGTADRPRRGRSVPIQRSHRRRTDTTAGGANENRDSARCRAVFGDGIGPMDIEFGVRTGKPAVEILQQARQGKNDLIVMSSRGHSGVRKMFFGSTTERVLRETPVPVLVTPAERPPGRTLEEIVRHVGHVLAPVDLSPASPHQVSIAAGIAEALSISLLVAHVLEPIAIPSRVRLKLPGSDTSRRSGAERSAERNAPFGDRAGKD